MIDLDLAEGRATCQKKKSVQLESVWMWSIVVIVWRSGYPWRGMEEFEIEHRLEGFQDFFSRIEKHNHEQGYSAAVSMEGYNGYARPLEARRVTLMEPCETRSPRSG